MKPACKGLTVLFAAFCFIAVCAAPASAVTDGDWSYAYTEGGVTLNSYLGNDTNLVIPSEIGGQTVVALREQLFYQNESVVSVTVPAGVRTIPEAAFYECPALETVTILSADDILIGGYAFKGCAALEEVHFAGGGTVDVGDYVFYGCEGLAVFDAASISHAGKMAFYGCALTSVSLARGASLDESAFANCVNLQSVGNNPIGAMGIRPFYGCTALQGVSFLVSAEGLTISENSFMNCSALQSVSFEGTGPVVVEKYAFCHCTELNSFTGASLSSVGEQAFRGCSLLPSVTLAEGAETGEAAFMECAALTDVGSAAIASPAAYAFAKCTALESVNVAAGADGAQIGAYAFAYCSNLESVHFAGAGQVSVGGFAFYGCALLNSFDASSISSVGESAFSGGCAALSNVNLAQGASVGYQSFKDCAALASVGPFAIGSLEVSSFYGCSALESVSVSAQLIPESAFYGCALLESVTLSDTSVIAPHAFSGCAALNGIEFPGTLMEICQSAFRGCEALESLVIPAGVTSVGDGAFYECRSLASVSLSEPLAYIGQAAFYYTALKRIDIPDTVTEIGENAFPYSAMLIVGSGTEAQAYASASGYPSRVRGSTELVEVGLDATTAQEKVDAIVDAYVADDMTDYDKALILHDYLITFADYDDTLEEHSPEGVLLRGTGVCQSYTEAYRMLLNAVGITNDTETGTEHIWNMILLDGKWYHIDCTWDDSEGAGRENHTYFCVTDYALDGVPNHERFMGAHHAVSLDMNYLYRTGGLDTRIEAIESLAAELLSEGETDGEITDAPFRGRYHIIADRLAVEYWQGQTVAFEGEEAVCRLSYESTPLDYDGEENVFAVSLHLARLLDLGTVRVDPGRAWTFAACEGEDYEVSAYPEGVVSVTADGVLTATGVGSAALVFTGNDHIVSVSVQVAPMTVYTLPSGLAELEQEAFSGTPVQVLAVPEALQALDAAVFTGLSDLCLLVLEGGTALPDASVLPEGLFVLLPSGTAPEGASFVWGHTAD